MQHLISVFGSSRPQPDSPDYEQARLTGRLLAQAGFAVATGGYMGTMEAVSRGAAEVGGRVIGVTSAQIERYRPARANPWVGEEIRYETLWERLHHLTTQNAGVVVLPGGVGTLGEMALVWNFVQVGEIPPRPIVLLGALWPTTLAAFLQSQHMPPAHAQLLTFAASPQQAVAALTTQLGTAGA